MLTNDLCDRLGISVPVILAPMGGAVGPGLAAAVSNAGALGAIPLWGGDAGQLRAAVNALRDLTPAPFAVNLNLAFPDETLIDACIDLRVPAVSLFWGNPSGALAKLKSAGITVMYTAGSAEEARRGADAGADIIVAQGWEAGGHVRGTVSTLALVPAVLDATGNRVPVVAAGGIADGRGLAAVLALGASAAWIGTRFLATPESTIHAAYRQALLAASEDETGRFETLFDVGWPDAGHRTLLNSTASAWISAGRPPAGERPGEHDHIGQTRDGTPIVRYQTRTPDAEDEGDIEAMSMWAGQGVGLVRHVQPAAEIVREIAEQAEQRLRGMKF